MSCRSCNFPSSKTTCNASPAPNQAGSMRRFCIHAKIQGMARKLSIPPSELRRAGRDPRGSAASSCSGVACLKKGTNCGSSRTQRR